jgi:hypothetical protein
VEMKSINTAGQALYPPDHLQVVRLSAASRWVLNPSVPHSLNHVRASTDAISLRSSIKKNEEYMKIVSILLKKHFITNKIFIFFTFFPNIYFVRY